MGANYQPLVFRFVDTGQSDRLNTQLEADNNYQPVMEAVRTMGRLSVEKYELVIRDVAAREPDSKRKLGLLCLLERQKSPDDAIAPGILDELAANYLEETGIKVSPTADIQRWELPETGQFIDAYRARELSLTTQQTKVSRSSDQTANHSSTSV